MFIHFSGNSLTGSGSSTVSSHRAHGYSMFHRSILSKDTLDAMEYPFLTMTKYPPGFILHLGLYIVLYNFNLNHIFNF